MVDCVVPVSADNPLAYNLVLVSLYPPLFGGGISEVHIAEALVSKAFSCSDKAVCQKMLDVDIAARAIQLSFLHYVHVVRSRSCHPDTSIFVLNSCFALFFSVSLFCIVLC